MKICLFTSGYIRTLSAVFDKNINLIKSIHPNSKIDICYSFWDQNHLSDRINDPWHYRINNYNFGEISKDRINDYFHSLGIDEIFGDIESFSISEKIIQESSFISEKRRLSSQYYKIYSVAERYFSKGYDLYVTIRPDVIIQKFISEQEVKNFKNKNSIIVNKNYWYNALYDGKDCNEYIWISNENTFVKSNSQYLHLNQLIKQVKECYGEIITGTHFKNLLFSGDISNIDIFDFDYRVVR